MRSIIQTLREGTYRDRLAIVADVFSILGVTLATVVGSLLSLDSSLNMGSVMMAIVISLLSLAGGAVVLVGFMEVSGWISNKCSSNGLYKLLFQFSIWALFVSLFILATFIWYEELSMFRYWR